MAAQIVDSLARDWDPKRYHDDYQAQVRALVKAKAKGKEIAAPEPEESAKVLDLTEALRASLESGARRPGRKSARPTPRKATRKSTRKSTRKRAPARRRTA
jgi:DNA end-binding protein Ku